MYNNKLCSPNDMKVTDTYGHTCSSTVFRSSLPLSKEMKIQQRSKDKVEEHRKKSEMPCQIRFKEKAFQMEVSATYTGICCDVVHPLQNKSRNDFSFLFFILFLPPKFQLAISIESRNSRHLITAEFSYFYNTY